MSLIERFFPIFYPDYNFFDNMLHHMEKEFTRMERHYSLQDHIDSEIRAMRNQMHQLLPFEPEGQHLAQIKPNVPIIQDKGETKLKLDFNLQGFKPDEVKVKILGNNLLEIQADHEVKDNNSYSKSTYYRQYSIPQGVEIDKLKSTLTKDGVLTIEAPATLDASQRLIPIKYIDNDVGDSKKE